VGEYNLKKFFAAISASRREKEQNNLAQRRSEAEKKINQDCFSQRAQPVWRDYRESID